MAIWDGWLVGWLVGLRFNATFRTKVISWRSVTYMCFLAVSHQYQHNLSFRSHRLSFLTCFCRGERRNYAGKKLRLNRGSTSQPPGHESDTLTTGAYFSRTDHRHCNTFQSSLNAVLCFDNGYMGWTD